MSSQPPEQSPLQWVRAELNALNAAERQLDTDVDKFRTVLLTEYETHINSLKTSFKESQKSTIVKARTALNSSDARIRDLEQSLRAEKKRVATLTSELSTQKQEAKTKHAQVTVELASQKVNHGLIKCDFDKAKSALEEASRRTKGLEEDLQAAKQQNDDLQAEVESAKRQPAVLQERLKAVEQQNADLEAACKAATQRASTAEDELNGFKSRFKQINDDMTALASCSEQQPPVSRPGVSLALAPTKQDSVEERKDGPQREDHCFRAQSLDPYASSPTSDKGPDLLHCQSVLNEVMHYNNRQFNRFFLSPIPSELQNIVKLRGLKLGPMNLSIMKKKLARGSYSSGTLFKADFNRMIADCKRLNHPDNLLYPAAERLATIFEQTWSAEGNSSHKSRDQTSQDQESRSHKRKASTEGLVSSEGDGKVKKAREDPSPNDNAVQPASPATEEVIRSSSSPSGQSTDNSQSPAGADASVWKGHLTTGPSIGVHADVDVVATQISVVKPVSAKLHWTKLLHRVLHVTAHAHMDTVEDELFSPNFCVDEDFVTLSLKPASRTGISAFDKLSRYLISKQRYATVSHRGIVDVRRTFLVPAHPQTTRLKPKSLDYRMLPRAQTKNEMFIIIVYHAFSADGAPILQALNDTIQAVHSSDMSNLAGIRGRLIDRPLPIYRPKSMAVFSAERGFGSALSDLPLSKEAAGSNLAEYPRSFLKLSYPKIDQSGPCSIDGIKLPESVFVLGRVIDRRKSSINELVVVDIENKDRSLWVIPSRGPYDNRPGTIIGLLTSKFPQSWEEWEKTIDDKTREVQEAKQLKNTGLRIERI